MALSHADKWLLDQLTLLSNTHEKHSLALRVCARQIRAGHFHHFRQQLILGAISVGCQTFRDIMGETGLARRTLEREIRNLKTQGKIERNKGGLYVRKKANPAQKD